MDKIRKTYEDHKEAILYVWFGGFTVLVSWLTYSLFIVWFGADGDISEIDKNLSNILSWFCGVLFAFVVNKWFVFTCRSTEPRVVVRELGTFFGARIFTGAIAFVLFPALLAVGMDGSLFGISGFPAKIITSLIEIVLNWVFSKYFIFTKKTVKETVCDDTDDGMR
jgi:putative flippase GtrA